MFHKLHIMGVVHGEEKGKKKGATRARISAFMFAQPQRKTGLAQTKINTIIIQFLVVFVNVLDL